MLCHRSIGHDLKSRIPGCLSASLFLHNHLSPCPLPPPGGGDGGQVESGVELLGGGGRHHLQLLFTTPQRWCHHQSPSPFPTTPHCRLEVEISPSPYVPSRSSTNAHLKGGAITSLLSGTYPHKSQPLTSESLNCSTLLGGLLK